MKNCKKLGVLLLALIMVTTSGVMSFADGDAAAADGEQMESQDSTVSDDTGAGETEEHPHNTVNCKTCEGTGKTPIPADMTLYEEAYKAFEQGAIEDNYNNSRPEVALKYLENQGLDIMEEFAKEYAEYMVNAGDNAWAIDQVQNHGDSYDVIVGYEGNGNKNAALENLEAKKKALKLKAPIKAAGYADCTECENGQVLCSGDFNDGILTSVQDNTGVVTHTCDVCHASYTTEMTPEETAITLAKNLDISGPTTAASGAQDGGTVACTIEVKNKGKFPVSGVKLIMKLGEGLGLQAKNPVTVNPKGSTIEIKDSEIVLTLDQINPNKTHKITVTTKLPSGVDVGTKYDFTLVSATLNIGEIATEIELPKKNVATVRVNKYKNRTVYMAGQFMGWYYGGNGTNRNTAEITNKLGDLDDIAGEKLCFADLDTFYAIPRHGDTIINNATQRIWRCVGFVPAKNGQPRISALKKTVFSNIKSSDLTTEPMELEAVKKYVVDNGGVLFGEAATGDQLANWEKTFSRSIYLQAVWFVENRAIEQKDYEELKIEPVVLPAERDTSEGIQVECDPESIKKWSDGHHFYEADLVVTIGKDAPYDAHVNLKKAIAAVTEELDRDPTVAVQSGDTIYYRLIIKNESGKQYTYKDKSALLATMKMSDGSDVIGTGFDGFDLSKYAYEELSAYARRINNAPLEELGLKSIDDASIGEMLRDLGYGKNEDLTNAEITQTYLGEYYLDWTNSVRASKGEEAASSFQDLSMSELSVFTKGDTGEAVQETCTPVVEALYYFFYGNTPTFNGKSLYNQMKDYLNGESELETSIPAAMNGTPYALTVHVDYLAVNNAFQDTGFDFRLEFDLEAPEPPTPTPTPDPTPEPDPTPDPQPLPPDDPLEEPDKPTVDPQPLPSDDPLIEDEDPKQPLPEDEHLADPDQPKTGDESDLALWLGVMILVSGAVVTMRVKRKKED